MAKGGGRVVNTQKKTNTKGISKAAKRQKAHHMIEEFKHHKLHTGSGAVVTHKDQMWAIYYSKLKHHDL